MKGVAYAREVALIKCTLNIHPESVGVTYRTQVFGIGYNTELVSKEVGQKLTWEDCIDPKWKGRFATDDRVPHLEILYQDNAWGREKTLDYARRLAANKPVIERSRSESVFKLTAGAYTFVCGIPWSNIRRQILWGSKNLEITFPEPVPVSAGDVIFVPRGAKSPNAGILWIMWSVSDEGQRILDKVQFTGNPLFPGSSVYKRIRGKKVAPSSWKHHLRGADFLKEILIATGFPTVR